jgi:hypothetical protein
MSYRSIIGSVILGIVTVSIATFALLPPIPQMADYHHYADNRAFFGIPNFLNVITNLPFFWLAWQGLIGLGKRTLTGIISELHGLYTVFFIGILLTGFGSGYYHWHPTNASLLWDRLPLTIDFMAFFAVIIGETLSIAAAKRSLFLLIFLGMASVFYWYWGEQQGHGDLRFYGLVQFLPMLLIPLMLILGHTCFSRNYYSWGVLAAYAAAKLAEYGDKAIFAVTGGIISGHSIKHLLAVTGVWLFLAALKHRRHLHLSNPG